MHSLRSFFVGTLMLACSSGTTPPSTSSPQPNSDASIVVAPDGAPAPDPLVPGSVIARLRLDSPKAGVFTLHGTLPIPKGTYPRTDGLVPFVIVDHDGTLRPTQVDSVSFYPNPADGADVVEVLANVSSATPGATTTFDVQYSPHAAPAPADTTSARAFLGSPSLLPAVASILQSPNAVLLIGTDVDGREYAIDLLSGKGSGKPMSDSAGPASATYRTFGAMELVKDVTSPASLCKPYPHLFLVHAYVQVFVDQPVVRVDLRISNGADGHSVSSPLDDAIGTVHFRSLELRLPAGWTGDQFPRDPSFAVAKNVLQIVTPATTGVHAFPHRFQIHRRLAIAPDSFQSEMANVLEAHDLGFVIAGTGTTGEKLFSWINPATARYLPQRLRMTSLSHMTSALVADLDKRYGNLFTGFTTGTSSAFQNAAMGAFHPDEGPYGGATGGGGISLGGRHYEVIDTASRNGYLMVEMLHRAHNDRQGNAYYNLAGEPTKAEDWKVGNAVPFEFFLEVTDNTDPFGDTKINACMDLYVTAAKLRAPYVTALAAFASYDYQHEIRYTSQAELLVTAANVAYAKDDLLREAEIGYLWLHPYDGPKNLPHGIRAAYDAAKATPGQGFLNYGRGEGWVLDVMTAAYSISRDAAWRTERRQWFELWADAADLAKIDCSGTFPGGPITKKKNQDKILSNDKYWEHQTWEQTILALVGLRGAGESVLCGLDDARCAKINAVLKHVASYNISDLVFKAPIASSPGLPSQIAIANCTPDAQGNCTASFVPFCTAASLPSDGVGVVEDQFYWPYGAAVGYLVSKDQTQLLKVGESRGVSGGLTGLLNHLTGEGNKILDNEIVTLAATREALNVE